MPKKWSNVVHLALLLAPLCWDTFACRHPCSSQCLSLRHAVSFCRSCRCCCCRCWIVFVVSCCHVFSCFSVHLRGWICTLLPLIKFPILLLALLMLRFSLAIIIVYNLGFCMCLFLLDPVLFFCFFALLLLVKLLVMCHLKGMNMMDGKKRAAPHLASANMSLPIVLWEKGFKTLHQLSFSF